MGASTYAQAFRRMAGQAGFTLQKGIQDDRTLTSWLGSMASSLAAMDHPIGRFPKVSVVTAKEFGIDRFRSCISTSVLHRG